MTDPFPTVLIYCQHVSGIGHYIRSSAIAQALSQSMQVVMMVGGALPEGVSQGINQGVEVLRLPAIDLDEDGESLRSLDERYSLGEAMLVRRQTLNQALNQWRPQVLLIEHFPLGRLMFIPEILPFLDAAQALEPAPLILCSLREVLAPDDEDDQVIKGTLSYFLLNTCFDGVLVHGDPEFAQFETQLQSTLKLKIPLHYTGFVVPPSPTQPTATTLQLPEAPYLLVSAGGGRLGGTLLRTVIQAYQQLGLVDRLQLLATAGIFLDEPQWQDLQTLAQSVPGVHLHRWIPNLTQVLSQARASISLCGYNTALDLMRTKTPALVIPGDEGTEEQVERATRLAQLGLVQTLPPEQLDCDAMGNAIESLLTFVPQPFTCDLGGAENTARLIHKLLA